MTQTPKPTIATPTNNDPESTTQSANATGTIPSQGSTLVTSTHDGTSVGLASKLAATASRHTAELLTNPDAAEFIDKATTQNLTRIKTPDKEADFFVGTDQSSFTVLLELTSNAASTTYGFDVLMPHGSLLILTDEGTVDIVGKDGITVGTFTKPWAVDAEGHEVNTYYKVDGQTLSQVIEPHTDAVYPIIADPKYTWGWITGTMYFNKSETGLLCTISLEGLRAIVRSGFWLPIVFAVFTALTLLACSARVLNKCVKVKSTLALDIYSGKYCQ
ncbi:MAG: hypothetical protein OXE04_00585 [bacterium]|nr:hypothetical protein [bacterium]